MTSVESPTHIHPGQLSTSDPLKIHFQKESSQTIQCGHDPASSLDHPSSLLSYPSKSSRSKNQVDFLGSSSSSHMFDLLSHLPPFLLPSSSQAPLCTNDVEDQNTSHSTTQSAKPYQLVTPMTPITADFGFPPSSGGRNSHNSLSSIEERWAEQGVYAMNQLNNPSRYPPPPPYSPSPEARNSESWFPYDGSRRTPTPGSRYPWSSFKDHCCCSFPAQKNSRKRLIFLGMSVILALFCVILVLHYIQLAASPSNMDIVGARGARPGPPPPSGWKVFAVTDALQNESTLAPLVYFGARIDWMLDDPESFNADIKHNASIQEIVFYIGQTFDLSATVNMSGSLQHISDYFLYTALLLRGTGAVMCVTILPSTDLSSVSNDALSFLAQKCFQINSVYSVQILLNFAPQQNGNWMSYGQDPVNFVAKFQYLASLIHGSGSVNMTAMVWSPHSGFGYPYSPNVISWNDSARGNWMAPTSVPLPSSSGAGLLDTNGNGLLDSSDDPWAPYYPGDEAVDWCGISFYNYGNGIYFPLVSSTSYSSATIWNGAASSNPLSSFVTNGGSNRSLNFYSQYAVVKQKPMIISGTGLAWNLNVGPGVQEKRSSARANMTQDRLTSNQVWWNTTVLSLSSFKQFPNIRAIIFDNCQYGSAIPFPAAKQVPYTNEPRDSPVFDLSVTDNSTILDAFVSLLANLTTFIQFAVLPGANHSSGLMINQTLHGNAPL